MNPLLALLVACAPAPEAPRVDAVVPEWGWRGEDTEIAVTGARFFPDVQVSTFERDAGRVDASFVVRLETDPPTPLDRVTLVDYQTLAAEVPEGLSVGVYDLTVVSPSGQTATLPDAFSVTETRADHLTVTVDDAAFDVNAAAVLHLGVEDPDHGPVAQALPVEVRATSDADAAGVTFLSGLADAVPVTDGVGVVGTLDPDGTATLLVSSSLPDDVTFTVSAVEDPVVDPDSVLVSWEPGALTRIEVVLPSEGFHTTAGESFDVDLKLYDRDGNELGPQATELLLYETCGTYQAVIDLSEPGPWPVTLTRACAENVLHTAGVGLEDGASDPFEVRPGAEARFAVAAYPSPLVAGTGVLLVQVDAVDSWGNIVPDAVGEVRLTDSVGGLDAVRGIGTQSCGRFDDGRLLCTASPLVAATGVLVTARDDAGFLGVSNPIDVVPDAPEEVLVDVDSPTLVAGVTFTVSVAVLDAWGNLVPFDPEGTEPVSFDDDTGTLTCAFLDLDAETAEFTCTVTEVSTGTTIRAGVVGLEGQAPDVFPVINGMLAAVDVDAFGSTYTAGAPFTLVFTGYDAFGNLYTVATSGAAFDLADTTGSMSPTTAFFDADGQTSVGATITVAGEGIRVTASQLGIDLGTSAPLVIVPAPMAGFEVNLAPWIDVAEGGRVEVLAVDAYGNVVPGYSGTVTLTPAVGLCEGMELPAFAEGRSAADLVCPDVGFQESFDAVDGGGLRGESDAFDVLDFACPGGPTAALALDGGTDSVVCIVSGVAEVDADTSASVAGSAPIEVWHLLDSEGQYHRSASATQTFTYTTAGTRRIEAVVVDSGACASETSGLAYVGVDDGSPTGPVDMVPSASSVGTTGTVAVDLSAADCAGDVAAFGTLRVRADLGTLDGVPTGSGLEVDLDGTGAGAVDWSFPEGYAAEATLVAGSATGSAIGSTGVTVTGDTVRPQVTDVVPAGTLSGTVGSLVIGFTDPMLPGSLVPGNISLTGPAGAVSLSVVTASDARSATLTPGSTVDAGSGVWTLTLADQVRDSAGNKISGDWSGSLSAWSGTFGAVADTLPGGLGCTPDVGRFTPDGDDGAGVEADAVVVATAAASAPAWWWLEVIDADDVRVRSLRAPGTDAVVEWDGRADDGRVLPTGGYTVRLQAVDAQGNVAEACEVAVAIRQQVEVP